MKNKPLVSLIAAIGKNRELGYKNKLLWHIPEDMQYFRDTTRGHAVIMGRKTFESIGHSLPKRVNIVVTRDTNYQAVGCTVVDSIEKAIEEAKKSESEDIFVIGGGEIYKQALPLADRLYLTLVDGEFSADAFFPEYPQFTRAISRRDSEGNGYRYCFVVLEKNSNDLSNRG